MLDDLMPEIVLLIISYISSVSDLLSLRLVSKALAIQTRSRLQYLAFKTIGLSVDNCHRLDEALLHLRQSALSKNIRWITIRHIYNVETLSPSYHSEQRHGSAIDTLGHSNISMERQPFDCLGKILATIAQVCLAAEELKIDSGMRDLIKYCKHRTSDAPENTVSNLFKRLDIPFMSVDKARQVILDLRWTTMVVIRLWMRAHLPITVLELDSTVLMLDDVQELALAIHGIGGLKRLSLRLFGCPMELAISQTSIESKAEYLASVLRNTVHELALSSTCSTSPDTTRHKWFLEAFMNGVILQCLTYISLEGFSVQIEIILGFLERHRRTMEYHEYIDFDFEGPDHLPSYEVTDYLNEELQNRDLGHLGICISD